jgi:hypothetical protein
MSRDGLTASVKLSPGIVVNGGFACSSTQMMSSCFESAQNLPDSHQDGRLATKAGVCRERIPEAEGLVGSSSRAPVFRSPSAAMLVAEPLMCPLNPSCRAVSSFPLRHAWSLTIIGHRDGICQVLDVRAACACARRSSKGGDLRWRGSPRETPLPPVRARWSRPGWRWTRDRWALNLSVRNVKRLPFEGGRRLRPMLASGPPRRFEHVSWRARQPRSLPPRLEPPASPVSAATIDIRGHGAGLPMQGGT